MMDVSVWRALVGLAEPCFLVATGKPDSGSPNTTVVCGRP